MCSSRDGASKWTGKEEEDFCTRNDCASTDVIYDKTTKTLHLVKDGSAFLDVSIPVLADIDVDPKKCFSPSSRTDLCLSWDQNLILDVRKNKLRDTQCYVVNLRSTDDRLFPSTCFSLADAHWFGGAELHHQRWPLNDVILPLQPYVSQDLVVNTDSFGNVLEPYWINSNGVGVFVDDMTPLHASVNANNSDKICFQAKYEEPHQPRYLFEHTLLNYTVCKSDDVKEIHSQLRKIIFDKPSGIPDIRMMKSPIWSTWARYKTLINETTVIQFADEILDHGFSNSQLEIDDMYSTKYGDLDFDPDKFPDPSGMIQTLKTKGFRTSAWITPFANLDSVAFLEGAGKGFWLKDKLGQVPALVKWWQGVGGIVDFTNQEATEWFVQRLQEMKGEYGLDTFKFDAGEMTFLPSSYKPTLPLANPGFFTTQYVDTVSRLGDAIEIRCGYKTQQHPVFVRMADKQSNWGYANGLRTLIPTVLTLGILGYPYILPDMIGGNGYGDDFSFDVVLPDRELYIRWLQITTYLPAMQFSFVPWDYDDEVVKMAKKMVDTHENIVTPILMKATKEAMKHGHPLIRPLWWIDPKSDDALISDSQFLIGNEMLVAPIVFESARSRDIYLPHGQWHDQLRGDKLTGPKWLRNYRIELDEIATFLLVV
ncbi:hypothetical protein FSP39_011435 [Pinctada imbricata]|uniref:Uncharacterized protein n=1 Tax=Pinctada imbricata TaxID=66713 RepID=A0AA88XM02_PINIB|nr:hypothetical protein FSP39_011435 [Pinctada imbricata]